MSGYGCSYLQFQVFGSQRQVDGLVYLIKCHDSWETLSQKIKMDDGDRPFLWVFSKCFTDVTTVSSSFGSDNGAGIVR